MLGDFKGTYRKMRTYLLSSHLFLPWSTVLWLMGGYILLRGLVGGGWFSLLFVPPIYIIHSQLKTIFMASIFGPQRARPCWLGFHCPLSGRETTDILAVLSLLELIALRSKKGDVCYWSFDPTKGFSCSSFFQWLLNPSSVRELVFSCLWKVKVPMKV